VISSNKYEVSYFEFAELNQISISTIYIFSISVYVHLYINVYVRVYVYSDTIENIVYELKVFHDICTCKAIF